MTLYSVGLSKTRQESNKLPTQYEKVRRVESRTEISSTFLLWVMGNLRCDFVYIYITLFRRLEADDEKPESDDMDKEQLITRLVQHEVRQEYMIKSIESLTKTVENGFNSLNCHQNEAKLNEVYLWHTGISKIIKHAKTTTIGAIILAAIGYLVGLIKEVS